LYDTVNLQWSTDESFAVIDGRANGLITIITRLII
jgi:hypothetical protein